MLQTIFTFNLREKILPGRVAIGTFDGTNPCLVAATIGDKVLIHNPHESKNSSNAPSSSVPSQSMATERRQSGNLTVSSGNKTFLNINQTIKSLAIGCIDENNDGSKVSRTRKDVLFIGTPTSILVYDVFKNSDIFYRDITDGANVIVVGKLGHREEPLVIVGGNGAIQGFNNKGEDCYWTVTGDNVTSMILYDSNDGSGGGGGHNSDINQLLVGSEDYDIRLFHDESVVYEISETDVVTLLCAMLPETFAYALSNGTVGVYHKNERLWRIKSKNQAVSIICWDINNDNIPELVTGWSSGKIDGRSIDSGDVIFKDSFSDPIAALLVSDYNCDGLEELIACSVTGEVRGYVPVSSDTSSPFFSSSMYQPMASKNEEDIVKELMKKRQSLLLELRNYEETRKVAAAVDGTSSSIHGKASKIDDTYGTIPSDTQLKSSIELVTNSSVDPSTGNYVPTYGPVDNRSGSIRVTLWTSNETIIRSSVIFAEGIFGGESFVIHPNDADIDTIIRVNLIPDKDIAMDLHFKSLVGYKDSIHYHVFELTRRLPKFALYQLLSFDTFSSTSLSNVSKSSEHSKNFVTFQFNEKIDSIIDWFNKNFILTEELAIGPDTRGLIATFNCFRDNSTMVIEVSQSTIRIAAERMELAGDIIQSFMCDHCNVLELYSTASFPLEMENLKELIQRVEDIQSVREQLSADIADDSATVRSLIIQAEDCRLIQEYDKMKKLYGELNLLNRDLVNRYKIRSKNHADLVDSLKNINILIQLAGNLRIGKPKLNLITSARNAIKNNNLNSLTKILSS